jgi:hypothetical protein
VSDDETMEKIRVLAERLKTSDQTATGSLEGVTAVACLEVLARLAAVTAERDAAGAVVQAALALEDGWTRLRRFDSQKNIDVLLEKAAEYRAALAAVTAERDAARADANRWRWIRPHLSTDGDVDEGDGRLYQFLYVANEHVPLPDGLGFNGVDEAVDAALAAPAGEVQP